eukprot:2362874-Pyramimonas_sp.AAC.1
MALRKACVSASVLFISREKISEPAIMAKGVSSPSAFAMPMAIAVFPVPGWPARSTARPAILPSRIIDKICATQGGRFCQAEHTDRRSLRNDSTWPR